MAQKRPKFAITVCAEDLTDLLIPEKKPLEGLFPPVVLASGEQQPLHDVATLCRLLAATQQAGNLLIVVFIVLILSHVDVGMSTLFSRCHHC